MIAFLSVLAKRLANGLGLEILKTSKVPLHNLLGLSSANIRTIIDVGANTGQFARWASARFPLANIYCFEPVPQSFQQLARWAGRQKPGRVSVFNFALGDEEGESEMFFHEDHSSSSSLLKSTEECHRLYPFTRHQKRVSIRITTLDKSVETLSLPLEKDVLLKLDVQGYEQRVLQGGSATLGKTEACILEIALEPLYESQPKMIDLMATLSDHGLSYKGNLDQSFGPDGKVVSIDALFQR